MYNIQERARNDTDTSYVKIIFFVLGFLHGVWISLADDVSNYCLVPSSRVIMAFFSLEV
jgi:hypothetical protein